MNKILSLVAILVLAALPALAQSQDTFGTTTITALHSPLQIGATFTGTGTSISGYIGQPVVLLSSTNVNGTTPTSTVKLQISSDNSSFSDLAGGAFSQCTTSLVATIGIDMTSLGGSNYVRVVNTLGGTNPSNTFSVIIIGRKKYN